MRGRWEALALTLLVLLASVPAAALPTPSPAPFVPRAPILIQADSDFTSANGVVGGTGTPSDPYVIAGWSITNTAGTGIRVSGVTKDFVVRDNAVDAKVGVHVSATASVGVLQNNKFTVRATGVLVQNADARIVDNSFIGHPTTYGGARGVELATSNSVVDSNAFLYLQNGVRAERGSPTVRCNDMHDDVFSGGVYLISTTNATVECNIITQCTRAMKFEYTIGTVVANNSISSCKWGIEAYINKDLTVSNNSIRYSLHAQVSIDIGSGNVTSNLIVDGRGDAVVLLRSPMLVANNTIKANARTGILLHDSAADVHANVLISNSMGISLEGGSIPWLVGNVMVNNTIGVSIPYASRQAIVNMSANFVNGVNIDGTVHASQRVFFYKAANVQVNGQVRDSGFSAGYYGAVSAQGGIVLYEVNTAHINGTLVAHHQVGLRAVNAFNVNVQGSVFFNNLVGIRAEAATSPTPVPNCAISVKDTNITIPQDPVLTLGIDVVACVATIARVNVSIVDIGIRGDANAQLNVSNATVFSTRIGLDLQGKPNTTSVSGSAFVGNRIGARFSGTTGLVWDNVFQGNAEVGVRLENAAHLDFRRNLVTQNREGVLDMEPCGGPYTCSSLDARQNAFLDNEGVGARVRGASTWEGDVASGNRGDGFDLGSAVRMRGVEAARNGGDGARIGGEFDVRGSTFEENEGDGLEVVGKGQLRDSNFTRNAEAGIRMMPTYVWAFHLQIERNLDGIVLGGSQALGVGLPPTTLPGLLPLIWEGTAVGANGVALDIHRSSLAWNERDAVRGANVLVNATHNWWGGATGPVVNVADTLGAYQNGVTPTTRFIPYYAEPTMSTVGPVAGL